MSQILNSLPKQCGQNIFCAYQNKTPTIEIARITNIPNWYFERVVFPGELILFEAVPEAVLEISSCNNITGITSDRFLCDSLRFRHIPDR